MKTVITYLAGVPSKNKKPEKTRVLELFAQGVNRVGDKGIASTGHVWKPSDVGVIQGFVHEDSPSSPHLRLRKSVVENQISNNKKALIIDSNLFLYINNTNPHKYLRYSFNGVFPTTGEYFWNNSDPSRWQQISKHMGITVKDWNSDGKYILICLQRNGGWSMQNLKVTDWISSTVTELRKHTDRPIIVRGHPGDKQAIRYLKQKGVDWTLSKNDKLAQDLDNAWATITYNSSPGVASAIEGIPLFVTDPNPKISQAYEVANTDLSQIENAKGFERRSWLQKLSMCHWSFEELETGAAWKHFRQFI
jgi:hypothetical protein